MTEVDSDADTPGSTFPGKCDRIRRKWREKRKQRSEQTPFSQTCRSHTFRGDAKMENLKHPANLKTHLPLNHIIPPLLSQIRAAHPSSVRNSLLSWCLRIAASRRASTLSRQILKHQHYKQRKCQPRFVPPLTPGHLLAHMLVLDSN